MWLRSVFALAAGACLFWQCSGSLEPDTDYTELEKQLPCSPVLRNVTICTDKSAYFPGDKVIFTADKEQKGLAVRYWHLGKMIHEALVSEKTWTWTAPATDFQGYCIELVGKDKDGVLKSIGTTAVDVSSDWTRFPRYGFLSKFSETVTDQKIASVIENLKSYHINGLQYYDWHMDHHHPLAGTPENPEMEWQDISGNYNSFRVVSGYISEAHKYNIASMFYDLCYGALSNAPADGVQEEWYAFKDRNHSSKDYHPLPGWRSNIYLVDPGNAGWLDYFSKQVSDVYKVFDFDGFHIDQLGNRGQLYNYDGGAIDMTDGYNKFIKRIKSDEPKKKAAFNAVARYGQSRIASGGVDFLYNEVWDTSFDEIRKTLEENRNVAQDRNSVLAAYMNYNKKPKSGEFNTAAVLLANAVIFAMGGSHLELGEHMLCSEYFPASNLSMSEVLEKSLHHYYDFLVAYENVLRDNVIDKDVSVSVNGITTEKWGPSRGAVNYLSKGKDDALIVHLLNFRDATHTDWRDDSYNQREPEEMGNLTVSVRTSRDVHKVWVASPDINGGAPQSVSFSSNSMSVSISVPYLKYWTMIVIE